MWMLTGANGYTMAHSGEMFSALVVDGERIVAVGEETELRLQFESRVDRIVDVEGMTVLPGFVDSHVHLSWLGTQMDALDLHAAKSKDDVLRAIRDCAAKLPDGAWIIGANWDEKQFGASAGNERGMPTIDDLDVAGGGRPVVLRRICGHVVLANRAAFRATGIGELTVDPAGGHFGRDIHGQIDGYAYEGATALMEQGLPKRTRAQLERHIMRAMQTALSVGITAVHSEDVRFIEGLHQTMDIYASLQQNGTKLRVHQLVGYDYLDEYADYLQEKRNRSGRTPADSRWLETGAVKLFSDGSLGGHTAFLSQPYADKPDSRGLPIYSQAELDACVRRVRTLGLPVAIHAIGDGGVDAVLGALEAAGDPVALPDRLIHAEIVNAQLIGRMQSLADSLAIDVQPRFAASDLDWAMNCLGAERVAYLCAWKSMLDARLHLCGGSDAPVEPISPLLGIHAAMTRRLPDADATVAEVSASRHIGWHETNPVAANRRSQALDFDAAFHLFGQGASYAIRREREKGLIKPGWLADFVVIDRDIRKQEVDLMPETKVLQTIVGGEFAYDSMR